MNCIRLSLCVSVCVCVHMEQSERRNICKSSAGCSIMPRDLEVWVCLHFVYQLLHQEQVARDTLQGGKEVREVEARDVEQKQRQGQQGQSRGQTRVESGAMKCDMTTTKSSLAAPGWG